MKPLTSNTRHGANPVLRVASRRSLEALHALGFRPAFFDCATCTTHPSRNADGTPADDHVLDGLPDAMVVVRTNCGRVIAARASLIAGFERNGFFYTQAAAWRAAREWCCAR